MSSVKETQLITQMVTHSHFVKQAEIKMTAFIIEHNLHFHEWITFLTWYQILFLTLK